MALFVRADKQLSWWNCSCHQRLANSSLRPAVGQEDVQGSPVQLEVVVEILLPLETGGWGSS